MVLTREGGKREAYSGICHTRKPTWLDIVLMWCILKKTFMITFSTRWCVWKTEQRIILQLIVTYPKGNAISITTYTPLDRRVYALLDWIKSLRFPDGYVFDLARNIDMGKHSIFGMKSHDGNVFMQRLIPIVFWELLPLSIWEALTELSLFFEILTSPKLKTTKMSTL